MGQRFHEHYLMNTMGVFGWPRRQSLFSGVGVPKDVLWTAFISMAQTAMAVGAFHPLKACQLVTDLLPESSKWDADRCDTVLRGFVTAMPTTMPETRSPIPIWAWLVSEAVYSIPSDFIRWNELTVSGLFRLRAPAQFTAGLAYGLLEPAAVKTALAAYFASHPSDASSVEGQSPFKDTASYLTWLSRVLDVYEATEGALPKAARAFFSSRSVGPRLAGVSV